MINRNPQQNAIGATERPCIRGCGLPRYPGYSYCAPCRGKLRREAAKRRRETAKGGAA